MCRNKPLTLLMSSSVILGFTVFARANRNDHLETTTSHSAASFKVDDNKGRKLVFDLEKPLIELDSSKTLTSSNQSPSVDNDVTVVIDGKNISVKSSSAANSHSGESSGNHSDKTSGGSKDETMRSPELSVPPLDLIEYPDDRPIWVVSGTDQIPLDDGFMSPFGNASKSDDDDEVSLSVVTLPCKTPEQAKQQVELLAQAATAAYAQTLSDFHSVGAHVFESVDVSEYVTDQYAGTVSKGGETLYESAWRLEFEDEDRKQILSQLKNQEVGERMAAMAFLSTAGLACLLASGGILGVMSRRAKSSIEQKNA